KMVTIDEGLEEGDLVAMNPRTHLDLLQLPELDDVSDRAKLAEIGASAGEPVKASELEEAAATAGNGGPGAGGPGAGGPGAGAGAPGAGSRGAGASAGRGGAGGPPGAGGGFNPQMIVDRIFEADT